MSARRGYVYYLQGAGGWIRARRRIEALERAAPRYQQRMAAARIQNRALESLSDEELQSLVEWMRAMCGEETATEPGDQGWQAYQRALAREQARSEIGSSRTGPTAPGGTYA